MNIIEGSGRLTFFLEGRIDADNAPALEKELLDAADKHRGDELTLDAGKLDTYRAQVFACF